jgi:hypothetical protein
MKFVEKYLRTPSLFVTIAEIKRQDLPFERVPIER